MWVAVFLSCAGPMAEDCFVGVKTDRLFAKEAVCAEYVDYALQDWSVVGKCFWLDGETL